MRANAYEKPISSTLKIYSIHLKHQQLIGLDFPNYHHLRFYSLGVTATIMWFCTNLISNTH